MVKLFASLILVASGVSFGTSMGKWEMEKIKRTEELYELISLIHTGIEKLSLPLGNIFSNYVSAHRDSETAKEITFTRGTFGDKIKSLSEKCLSPLTIMEIKEFTDNLGTVDKDTQIRLTKNALHTVEKELSQKRLEYQSKSKLYKTLSLLVSCVVAVLLY